MPERIAAEQEERICLSQRELACRPAELIKSHSADLLVVGAEGYAGPMPAVGSLSEAETEIMAYETTTEGTPCSPAFPSTPEGKLALVNYCAEHVTTFGDHRADAETWAAIPLRRGSRLGRAQEYRARLLVPALDLAEEPAA